MAPRFTLIVLAFLWLTLAPPSPLISVASAYQCSDLTEYVELWDDASEQNSTLGLYVRGSADNGGEPCSITVRTYMLGPGGGELTFAYGSGTGYATSTVVVHLDESAVEGTYSGKVEGWSQGVHYGCAVTDVSVTSFTANYQKTSDSGDSCGYFRCTTGNCGSASGRRTLFPGGVCPAFAKFHVLRVGYLIGDACFFSSPIGIPSCSS